MRSLRVCSGVVALLAIAAGTANADIVYDSSVGPGGSGTAGLLFTTNNPNASLGDDLTMDGTVPGGTVARMINFAYVVPANTAVVNADALITFYDVHDIDATGTDPALHTVLGVYRHNVGAFEANANARGFATGMIDLAAQIPGGAMFSTGAGGISIRFVEAGTDTILTGATITPAFSTGTVGVGSNVLTTFYLDGFGANLLDGVYTGAERVGFGGANANNNKLWIQIDNVPAPGAAGLMAIGLAALGRRRR